MPATLDQASQERVYLRATPIPRALESVQQAFIGMWADKYRTAGPPVITIRAPAMETLFPNDTGCRRLGELFRTFGARAARKWNDTPDMAYIDSKIGKWMPKGKDGKPNKVAVDSNYRLSGLLDTVNATLAHGPATRLPAEFYDPQVRANIDKICVEEWFAGYSEMREYRTLASGSLAGDLVSRMVDHVQRYEGAIGKTQPGAYKFALAGAHDTTLAGLLASLGAFRGESWPPYTSHVAVELFKQGSTAYPAPSNRPPPKLEQSTKQGWFAGLFGGAKKEESVALDNRTPLTKLPTEQRAKMEGYYVRIRYNDRPVVIPGCRLPGNHLDGDEGFCTLEAFKAIVDAFTPRDWKTQCLQNLGETGLPEKPEWSGFAEGSES